MILCADIGNTNITIGVYDGDRLNCTARLATDRQRTADQYAMDMHALFDLYAISAQLIEGSIIASVVPELTDSVKRAVKKITGTDSLILGPGLKSGIRIRIDSPSQLGADLLAGAVGAAEKYPLPCLVVDLGTCTKIYAIDKDRSFLGGSIMPGLDMSVKALSTGTSQLPAVDLSVDRIRPIGTNTIECMVSGIILGTASMIDGMISKMSADLNGCTVVATGGKCKNVMPFCEVSHIVDDDLVLDGLRTVYIKNRKMSLS